MTSVPRVCPVSALNRAVFRPLTASKALFDSFERDLREANARTHHLFQSAQTRWR